MAKKTFIAAYMAVGALFLSASVLAATPPAPTDTLRAKVIGTVISESGNCLANLYNKPVYVGTGAAPACNNLQITFKCDTGDKDIAYHKFDIAQKSEITGQVMIVKLTVDPNDSSPNAPCYAASVESTNLKK